MEEQFAELAAWQSQPNEREILTIDRDISLWQMQKIAREKVLGIFHRQHFPSPPPADQKDENLPREVPPKTSLNIDTLPLKGYTEVVFSSLLIEALFKLTEKRPAHWQCSMRSSNLVWLSLFLKSNLGVEF